MQPHSFDPTAEPRPVRFPAAVEFIGNSDGPLRGHTVVLTGNFPGGKGPLSARAAALGCNVEANLTKSRTTILVVGNSTALGEDGIGKSMKHARAEKLNERGASIAILSAVAFEAWLDTYSK
jgi:NAD-dependent DNA ligase